MGRDSQRQKIPVVYLVTCAKHDRKLVGHTVEKLWRRLANIRTKRSHPLAWHMADHGPGNFNIELLDDCHDCTSRQQAIDRKLEWARRLNTLSPEHLGGGLASFSASERKRAAQWKREGVGDKKAGLHGMAKMTRHNRMWGPKDVDDLRSNWIRTGVVGTGLFTVAVMISRRPGSAAGWRTAADR